MDRGRIVRTAIDVLNDSGLKELSMRRIADALGVKAAALYYHVKDKDELLQLLSDKISADIVWPEDGSWQERIVRWAASFRSALHRYRDAADIFNATLVSSSNRLRQIEALYGLLESAGFHDGQIPWMASMVKNYVLSFVAEETRFAGLAARSKVPLEELGKKYAEAMRQLPPDKFPRLIRLASGATNSDWETEFHFGLQVLVDGFSAKLDRNR